MKVRYNTHVKRIIVVFILIAAILYPAKWLLIPDSFGIHGHYRADSIEEEAAIKPRHMTNVSCLSCHEYEYENHKKGLHKAVSCEFCHGPYADHVENDVKVAALPVKEGKKINVLCLRCHNKAIQARPGEVVKTIVMPDHVKDQEISLENTCNQCHYVHAPLKYINRPQKIVVRQEIAHG